MVENRSPRPVVLMTGAAGLIGTKIIDRLSSDYEIVGLDVKIPDASPPGIQWVKVDLTDDQSTQDALNEVRRLVGSRVASVIHLAAYYDFSGAESPLYKTLTVEGTRRMLSGLQDFEVEQFVFSSSLLVMEPAEETGRHLSELSPTHAKWAYPQSKLEAEKVIHTTRGEIPTVVLRIAGVYDEMCHSLPISQQISRIYERQMESHVFPGDSDHGQALVHLDDLADCFRQTVEARSRLKSEELFLIAEPDVMSYAEVQDTAGELIYGEEWTTVWIPKFVAKAGAWVQDKMASSEEDKPFIQPWMVDLADDHYAVNISHSRSALDWNPQHRLRSTMPDIIENLLANPRGWYEENKLPWPEDADDLPTKQTASSQQPK